MRIHHVTICDFGNKARENAATTAEERLNVCEVDGGVTGKLQGKALW